MTDFAAQRAEICRIGRSLFERGLVHATAGNISVRLPDGAGLLITPTDACLGFLTPDALAHTDAQGAPLGGPRPSKTLELHRRIYASEPDAHCVLHTHSTHLVALTLAGVWSEAHILPPITPYFVMKVGRVPLIPYHRPGAAEAAECVATEITQAHRRGVPLRAVMLDRLGPTVWHASPAAAMATLEELEETARLWLMTTPRPAPLTEPQIDDLRSAFGARW
jgi:ribulose-5-phosphate 4-epimerase/fuculose-1-phosphate aldolase